jgi:hypothetical protein
MKRQYRLVHYELGAIPFLQVWNQLPKVTSQTEVGGSVKFRLCSTNVSQKLNRDQISNHPIKLWRSQLTSNSLQLDRLVRQFKFWPILVELGLRSDEFNSSTNTSQSPRCSIQASCRQFSGTANPIYNSSTIKRWQIFIAQSENTSCRLKICTTSVTFFSYMNCITDMQLLPIITVDIR